VKLLLKHSFNFHSRPLAELRSKTDETDATTVPLFFQPSWRRHYCTNRTTVRCVLARSASTHSFAHPSRRWGSTRGTSCPKHRSKPPEKTAFRGTSWSGFRRWMEWRIRTIQAVDWLVCDRRYCTLQSYKYCLCQKKKKVPKLNLLLRHFYMMVSLGSQRRGGCLQPWQRRKENGQIYSASRPDFCSWYQAPRTLLSHLPTRERLSDWCTTALSIGAVFVGSWRPLVGQVRSSSLFHTCAISALHSPVCITFTSPAN
jgi:hypothetical protein